MDLSSIDEAGLDISEVRMCERHPERTEALGCVHAEMLPLLVIIFILFI